MCIGADDGCQVVPEPIAPIDMTLVLLEPTRIPISLPFITSNGPIVIDSFELAPDMSMPFIWSSPGFAPGLGDGTARFISIFSGDAVGLAGVAPGIFMPGMWICGDALGLAARIGMFRCGSISVGDACGFGGGELAGVCMPGMFMCGSIFSAGACGLGVAELAGICIPGMLLMSCVLGACSLFRTSVLGLRDAPRRFTFAFGFDFGFDFALGLLMPGMLWPSCCENATGPLANEIKIKLTKNKYL
jgi:hypothetical protein